MGKSIEHLSTWAFNEVVNNNIAELKRIFFIFLSLELDNLFELYNKQFIFSYLGRIKLFLQKH